MLKQPTYHRQRFLLSLIAEFDEPLSFINLQKLLFLTQVETQTEYYDFVPYHYGCYSFQASADIDVLAKQGWVTSDSNQVILKQRPDDSLRKSYFVKDDITNQDVLNLRGNPLINYLYTEFPYYAINSRIAKKILTNSNFVTVAATRAALQRADTVLYTIGYEGISFEQYVNKLIQNNIKVLCDVRKNPYSRKLGFSIQSLSTILPKIGIEYVHLPELGIESANRSGLSTKEDFVTLFDNYSHELVNQDKQDGLASILRLLEQYQRVAITCFEKHHTDCHRHCVADNLKIENNITIKNL